MIYRKYSTVLPFDLPTQNSLICMYVYNYMVVYKPHKMSNYKGQLRINKILYTVVLHIINAFTFTKQHSQYFPLRHGHLYNIIKLLGNITTLDEFK